MYLLTFPETANFREGEPISGEESAMPKITFIGAGSLVFTRNLCSDILLTPALQESTITLMDVDAGRLAQARRSCRR
jgi:alpha-galactosidase/6-phospho-beta-glucosidase family protein